VIPVARQSAFSASAAPNARAAAATTTNHKSWLLQRWYIVFALCVLRLQVFLFEIERGIVDASFINL
jgi:hypothetical protein